ncbi:MAG: hypothetical protein NTW32_21270 [Chloroflexi bacterium]|nr:hypothetical protein [Chloroflexota bacterium]
MNNTPSMNKPFTVDSLQAQALKQRLQEALPGTPWQPILEAFNITGVLDTEQLQAISKLERMQLTRLLDKLESFRNGLPPILNKLDKDIRRPGVRGRAPKIYMLGESGAGLLRLLEYEDAHACGLNSETAICHALGMMDIHLAASRASLGIITDRIVNYGEQGILRPDHQLTGAKTRILEVEQAAGSDTLRRLVTSLEHKQAFFTSAESTGFEHSVLMLIQLPRGPVWERTTKAWGQAIELCVEKLGKPLNFQIHALPLQDFLRQPDWNGSQREDWVNLYTSVPGSTVIQKAKSVGLEKGKVPSGLMYRTTRDDQIVLAALWQDFRSMTSKNPEAFPMAGPDFLHLMHLIYIASHGFRASALELACLPHASIYLLQQYLDMHPELRTRLTKAIHFGRGTMRWNSTTIMHRMQVVINTFLAYHGWRPDGPLLVYSNAADWKDEAPRTFGVVVKIRDEALLMRPRDDVLPMGDELIEFEMALEWVLYSLFNYAHELGFGRVEYW